MFVSTFTYVFRGRKIALMSVDGNSAITLMKTLQTSTEVWSICPYDVNRFIVGTVDDRRHARVIGLNGQESDIQLLTFPDKTHGAGNRCTYLPSDGVLAVTDYWEHTVQLYQIGPGTSRTVKDDRIQRPAGICGAQGRVFVASSGTGTVVEMTVQGEIVKCHEVGMKLPHAISVTQDGGHMVVADSVFGDKTIKVFKMEYA